MLSTKLRVPSLILRRTYSKAQSTAKASKASQPKPSSPIDNVIGLTAKCVKPIHEPVGPGASKDGVYKVPEYFCFNRFSYMEAEVEMAKYRCPQPTAPIK